MQCEFDIPSRVIIGADTRAKVAQEARSLEWSRVLIVSDPFGETAGRVSEIAELLSKADIGVSVYADLAAEPDTEIVQNGLERFRAEKCDGIIAIGGGSVLFQSVLEESLNVDDFLIA